MLDFTEQVPSTESLPKLSVDTQTESDNLRVTKDFFGTEITMHKFPDSLADPEVTASTIAKLKPYLTKTYVQDDDEPDVLD